MGTSARRRAALAPIPRRIPPLTWRRPFLLWTPCALALAIGWPALAFSDEAGLFTLATTFGAVALASTLALLGAAWLTNRPPRARKHVIRIAVWSGAVTALAAPFALTMLLNALPADDGSVRSLDLPSITPFVLAPAALLLGLPSALAAGVIFAFVALVKPERARPKAKPRPKEKWVSDEDFMLTPRVREAQPFV